MLNKLNGVWWGISTVEMNLQQVLLHFFFLQQISQHTLQQLQTQKHRQHQTVEPPRGFKHFNAIHHLLNLFFFCTHKPPQSVCSGCRGSPLFFLLLWDQRLAPSYSPRGQPSASAAPGGVWKYNVQTTTPIMLLQVWKITSSIIKSDISVPHSLNLLQFRLMSASD